MAIFISTRSLTAAIFLLAKKLPYKLSPTSPPISLFSCFLRLNLLPMLSYSTLNHNSSHTMLAFRPFAILLLASSVLFVCAAANICPKGSHITPQRVCEKCPVGTFQNLPDQSGCRPCPSGFIANKPRSPSCTACPPSYTTDLYRTMCTCPEGSVAAGPSALCKKCKPGTFFVAFGSSASCSECGPGQYQPFPGQSTCLTCPKNSLSYPASTACTTCKPGEVMIRRGKCGKCAAGRSYDEIMQKCVICKAGKFKAVVGQSPCLRCPMNGFSGRAARKCTICKPGQGLMNNGRCDDCPAGSHYDKADRKCVLCEPGTFTEGKNAWNNCFACAGTSFSFRGATKCTKCPGLQVLLVNGQCGSCPLGTAYNTQELKCEPCGINTTSDGGRMSYCQPCPSGAFAKPRSARCFTCKYKEYFLASTMKCGSCASGSLYDEQTGMCS